MTCEQQNYSSSSCWLRVTDARLHLQTPHFPPSLAQCLQYLQFLQALQGSAPVQVAENASSGIWLRRMIESNIRPISKTGLAFIIAFFSWGYRCGEYTNHETSIVIQSSTITVGVVYDLVGVVLQRWSCCGVGMRYWWVNQNQTFRHKIAGG